MFGLGRKNKNDTGRWPRAAQQAPVASQAPRLDSPLGSDDFQELQQLVTLFRHVRDAIDPNRSLDIEQANTEALAVFPAIVERRRAQIQQHGWATDNGSRSIELF